MQLNKYEIEKIESAIQVCMSQKAFTYSKIDISCIGSKLILKFENVKHKHFKNVRILSSMSYIQDTPLFTYAYIKLRFLHGGYTSPVIGFNIRSIKVTL